MPIQPKTVAADFYHNPTPAGAVALAIADAKADGNGTPEFFDYLHRAKDTLESPVTAAAPELLAALQVLTRECESIRWDNETAMNNAREAIKKATL